MEERYEDIEKYLEGKLTGEELRAFETAMKEEPELAEEVALHQRLGDFLEDVDAIDFRKNLSQIGDAIQDSVRTGENDDNSLQWGSRIIGSIIVVLMVGALIYSLLRKPSPEIQMASDDLISETDATDSPQIISTDTTNDEQNGIMTTRAEEKSTPAQERPPKPTAVRDVYSPSARIENLMDPSNRSKVYDFELSAKFKTFPATILEFEGELVCSSLPQTSRFVLEVFDNVESNYDGHPFLSFLLDPVELDEDRPFAFGNKTSFFVGADTTIELKKGLYYYQVRLNDDPNPLLIKKFTN